MSSTFFSVNTSLQVDTYNAPYPDGVLAQGGYSSMIRVDKQFVFAIPDELESEKVGPLFCAGATVYSPLVRNGTGPGKSVGIVGVGGLGGSVLLEYRVLN